MKTMLCKGKFCKKKLREEENKRLYKELNRQTSNISKTFRLLERFEFYQELKRTGIWLKPDELKIRASHTLKHLTDSNLIKNGLIVPGMIEHILQVIKGE